MKVRPPHHGDRRLIYGRLGIAGPPQGVSARAPRRHGPQTLEDGRSSRDGGGVVRLAEDRPSPRPAPRRRPRSPAARSRRVMPPSTWMRMARPAVMARRRRIFSSVAGMNFWPPKPGLTVITRIRSIRSSTYSTTLSGVAGIEGHAGQLAQAGDRLQRPVEVGRGLGMDDDAVRTRLGERLQIGVDRRDHQVGVEALGAVRADGADEVGAEGEVGDEVAVHDVEMEPVRPGGVDRAHLLAQPREVAGQDRGRDQDRVAHGCIPGSAVRPRAGPPLP